MATTDYDPVTITRADWYSLMQTLRQLAAGRPDIHAGINRLEQQAMERKTVDHRALLIKYITHVGENEGTSFLSDHWKDDQRFTAEEWAELQRCDKESEE